MWRATPVAAGSDRQAIARAALPGVQQYPQREQHGCILGVIASRGLGGV
jgi:hypothetical protein